MYIYENDQWPQFRWNHEKVDLLLDKVCRKQGLLYGRLADIGFNDQLEAMANSITKEVMGSSEIEGIRLNMDEVRSSVARRLGIEQVKATSPSHYVESVVAVMLDAINHYDQPLTHEKLCAWQSAFFPTGFSEGVSIEVGAYRTHEEHIVSGMMGREKVHYVAPPPQQVKQEMEQFLAWFNSNPPISAVVRAAIAHLWFVSIHPFEDGNGRLARILSDMMLARGDKNRLRFYNLSSEINRHKSHYYNLLERTQHGNGDITEWVEWMITMLGAALDDAQTAVGRVLHKSIFWKRAAQVNLNERQTQMLNLFLDGYEAKITTKNWASLAKCSTDTALRDLQQLTRQGLIAENVKGAKRPSYSIVFTPNDRTRLFSEIAVTEENGTHYLTARYQGTTQVRERITTLDAELYGKGQLPVAHLLDKYCAFVGNWPQATP